MATVVCACAMVRVVVTGEAHRVRHEDQPYMGSSGACAMPEPQSERPHRPLA